MMETWTCHVCGDERPDDKIGVYKRIRQMGPVEFQENVRYCNDRDACVTGAKDVHFAKEEEDEPS